MDENHIERIRGAAQAGNIDELYALIRENAYILEGIDQIPFCNTPLHIAAAAGHTDFAMEIMNLKPSLAQKLNQDGFSPIHLALQNGQKELVLDLVGTNKDLVLVKGKEGKTPFHFVVEEGDLTLLVAFLLSCPECIKDVTNQNETALHIAAQKDLLEVVEVLVGWLRRSHDKDGKLWEKEVLNWKNKEGNTVLHIAVSNNQLQMIKLLLDCGIDKNVKNWIGLTAMDIFLQDQTQTQVDKDTTLGILNSFGCLKASSIHNKSTFVKFLRSKISFSERSNITVSRLRKNISDNSRDALLVVLVLILTATYQSAVNPPFELAQASLRQNTNYQRLTYPPPPNNPLSGILFPPPPPNNFPAGFPTGNNNNDPSKPNNFFDVKIDPVALSFSIFNAIDFMVTLLVTLFILPWVPYGGLLHVLLLFVFIFFLVSMGLSFVLTTSNIGVILFCIFLGIAIILGIFIVRNKVRHRKVYRECIKELGDRVRLQKHHDDDVKKK